MTVGRFLFLLLALSASGCVGLGPLCERPYIGSGDSCCLDADSNGVCDSAELPGGDVPVVVPNEPPQTLPEEPVTTIAPPRATQTTSTTTIKATTTSATLAPTTTMAKAACNLNSDCGGEVLSGAWCQGNMIISQYKVPMCTSPGSANAKCDYKGRVSERKSACDGLCHNAKCYPLTCGNGVWDVNEEEMDCGGVCPPCDAPIKSRCVYDSQCGQDGYRGEYRCYNGGVMREYVDNYCSPARLCESKIEHAIVDSCNITSTCVPGKDHCVEGGTCTDCIRNQDEAGLDCGGVCRPCAPTPAPNDRLTTHRDYNLTGDYIGGLAPIHHGYLLKFVRPLMSGDCQIGMVMSAEKEGEPLKSIEASRYKNGLLGQSAVGFYWASEDSASIWVSVP